MRTHCWRLFVERSWTSSTVRFFFFFFRSANRLADGTMVWWVREPAPPWWGFLFRFFLFFSSGLFLKWTIRDINWRPVTPSSDWYLGFFFRLSLQHAYYCYLRLITLWPGRGNLIFFCLSNYSCTASVCWRWSVWRAQFDWSRPKATTAQNKLTEKSQEKKMFDKKIETIIRIF